MWLLLLLLMMKLVRMCGNCHHDDDDDDSDCCYRRHSLTSSVVVDVDAVDRGRVLVRVMMVMAKMVIVSMCSISQLLFTCTVIVMQSSHLRCFCWYLVQISCFFRVKFCAENSQVPN